MPNQKYRKGGKVYTELTAGLPETFTLTINWDAVSETCDINRRNCAIYNALMKRDDLTRASVGFDEINFIWRGDGRLAVTPSGAVAKIIAKNDLAAAGDIPWPTGTETVRVDLRDVRVKKDLRPQRETQRRKARQKPDKQREYQDRYRSKIRSMDYSARMKKKEETERLSGRFA